MVDECRRNVEARRDHVLTYRMRSLAGHYRGFRDHVHVREDGTKLFGIMIDITDLHDAQAATRASEEKYRRLFEAAPDGIGVYVDGRFVLANEELARIAGMSNAAELIGEPVRRFVHPDYQDLVAERQAALSHGESVPLAPEKILRADGSSIDVEVSALPVSFGPSMAVQIMVRDITERRQAEARAREAESRLQVISTASNDALWEWSYKEGMVWMNESYRTLFGLGKESEMSVDLWMERVHPDDRQRVNEAMADALQRRLPMWTDEYRFRNPQGEWMNILARCRLRFSTDGQPERLVGGMMDVTELRLAQEQRRDVENLYGIFLENSMVGVYIIRKGHIIYANPKAREIFGYTSDEFVQIPDIMDTIAPEHREMVREKMSARLTGATSSVRYTARCLRKNGEPFYAEFMGSVADMGGERVVIGNFTDVTDRRRSEIALQTSEERLRLLVENVDEIIYSTDTAGNILWLNSAFERLTGFQANEWIGRPFLEVLAPESSDLALDPFRLSPADEDAGMMRYRLRTSSGGFLEIETSARPVMAHGEIVGTVGVARDISVRRQLERQLDQARRLSGLGQLAASIAHEFNNVLMGIQPFAEVLTRPGQSRETVVKAGGYIAQSIERGKSVSLQILRFANPQRPELVPVRLRQWLEDVAAEARAVVGPSCTVRLDIGVDANLRADPQQLSQVIMNLVLNARDAMPDGGTITITAGHGSEAESSQIRLVVADQGAGIPPHQLQNIFDPLFTTKRTGTGLGLSIAHQIITSHGGRMYAENLPDGGAAFHVILDSLRVAGESTPELEGNSPQRPARARRILLVEDDEAVAAGLVMLLELEGFEVERLPDGSAVVETYERMRPEVLVLDMNLPGASGAAIYADLRHRFGPVSVIFSTGHLDKGSVEESSTVRLLLKPYSFDVLLNTIETLLIAPAMASD